MTTLVMLGILCLGILGYRFLPVSDLPNVDFPTVVVSVGLPGANPDTMPPRWPRRWNSNSAALPGWTT